VVDETGIQLRYQVLDPVLDERSRRRFAAAEAKAAGRGGVAAVSRLTGMARSTIIRGLAELAIDFGSGPASNVQPSRTRRPGGGRKKLTETDPTLLSDLQGLVEPATRGDPEAALLWTSRSLRNLADALRSMGHRIGHNVVADLLRELNYSLQANRKTREGAHNPDRDAHSAISMRRSQRRWRRVNRRSRSTPRRRNWLVTLRTPVGNCAPRESPSRCGCTISRSLNSVAPRPMGSTTSLATPAG
jgi:hypothetical protein